MKINTSKLFLISSLLITSFTSFAYAMEILSVNNDSNALCSDATGMTYCTIQSAIDHAQIGDVVSVSPGTYKESVTINKEIMLVGIGDSTIINPDNNKNGITITANNVVVKDLKIVTSNTSEMQNNAIRIEHTNGVDIVNNSIETKGEGAKGILVCGAISGCLPSSHLTLKNNKITIANYASGIYTEEASPAHNNLIIGGALTAGNTVISNEGNPLELYDVSDSEVSYNSFKTIGTTCDCSNVIWSSERSNLSNLIFKNNTMDGSDGTEVAFITNFLTINVPTTKIANVTIENNIFKNWGIRALRVGDTKGVDSTTVSGVHINGNTFEMTTNSAGGVIGGTASDISGANNIFNVSGGALVESANNAKLSSNIVVTKEGHTPSKTTTSLTGEVVSAKDGRVVTGKVLGASTFNFQKDLKMGSQNNDVKELQKMLIAEGFLFYKATGYFGTFTKQALIQWQAKNGIVSTGFFGKASRAFLAKGNQ